MRRVDALKLGLKIYHPDKPCGKGHTSGRYSSTGTCVECGKMQNEIIKRSAYFTRVYYDVPREYREYMDAMFDAIMIQNKLDLQKSIADTKHKVMNQ
jgi:hypothetical protein